MTTIDLAEVKRYITAYQRFRRAYSRQSLKKTLDDYLFVLAALELMKSGKSFDPNLSAHSSLTWMVARYDALKSLLSEEPLREKYIILRCLGEEIRKTQKGIERKVLQSCMESLFEEYYQTRKEKDAVIK